MALQRMALPARKGSVASEFTDDFLREILDTLKDTPKGQGVLVGDPLDTEGKASSFAGSVRRQLIARHNTKVHAHVMQDSEDPKKFYPVVSAYNTPKNPRKPKGEGEAANPPDAPQDAAQTPTDPPAKDAKDKGKR